MSSVQYFRELISERLTAAAEEIFSEFEKTIIQYEDVINRQRRLLDIGWKQKIKFRTVDFSQQHVCNQQKKQSLAQPGSWIREEPEPRHCQKELEPPTIKQEQEELWISQDVEQLVLKQEDETFMKIQYESSCDETFMRSNVVQQEDEAHGHHSPPVIGWKPVVKLHRIDPHQLPVSMEEEEEEEVLTDQQICNQERNFSLDQDEPQPPQIREDQVEVELPQMGVDSDCWSALC
ncbi:uncharacterized protein LOC108246280 isoform X2 [Kryptolebias marmoratus]|uniref:uncharacterized protein LOC108246280 isoform X2 n=1 Tax=Kryptolebias marmoratus TaxID=37003 RepID=UPI000D530F7E|nr:uncharacterized protein LOC108246280 isoform X2 [Kryptolebias marmoratus]